MRLTGAQFGTPVFLSKAPLKPSEYHPYGWHKDVFMATTSSPRISESEKLTINLGYVDLGQIDLLVAEGFYSNRSDFIRTAIRSHLGSHGEALRQVVARKMLVLGLQRFTVDDLTRAQAAGEKLQIRVLGLASIADDVPAQLAADTIESITVLGALHASPAVRAALAGRIT